MRYNSEWRLIFIGIQSFAILWTVMKTNSETNARPIFTTTNKINHAINSAVEAEKNNWQKKVNENEAKIRSLQDDLNKALEASKKLTSEKNLYEQQTKTALDAVTKEKAEALEMLNKTKSELETTKQNLNTSIENLKQEVQNKEKEQEALNKKISDTEKAKKDSEALAKKNLNKTIRQYNLRIKNLNKKITQKTNQLKSQSNQLKNLNLSVETQNASMFKLEAKTYNDIELLKGNIRTLQTELKALITQAKETDIERIQRIKIIRNRVAIEKQNLAEQMQAIQEADVQNLLRIEKLNNLIQRLIAKNHKLEMAGKILEKRLMAKINDLKNRQALYEKQYELLAHVYANAESQNLIAIDLLKQELNNATMKNRSLFKIANYLTKAKLAEDVADSQMEANMLLKIEELKNELNNAIQKNEMLIKNIKMTKRYIDNIKKGSFNTNAKCQNEIKSLTSEIKTADTKYKELLQKYHNRNWIIETLNDSNNLTNASSSANLPQANIPVEYAPQWENYLDKYPQAKRYSYKYAPRATSQNSQYDMRNIDKSMNYQYCEEALKDMEYKYNKLLKGYNDQEKWMFEYLRGKYPSHKRDIYNHKTPEYLPTYNQGGHYQKTEPHRYPQHRTEYWQNARQSEPESTQQNIRKNTPPPEMKSLPGAITYKNEYIGRSLDNFKNTQTCLEELRNIEDKYKKLLNKYNYREKWMIEKLNSEYKQYKDKAYNPNTLDYSTEARNTGYYHNDVAHSQRDLVKQTSDYSERNIPQGSGNVVSNTDNARGNRALPTQQYGAKLSEDELVKFALDTTLKAIKKIANYDEDKINASLRLIATGVEMPKRLNAILEVIKDKYNPSIYNKVIREISKMYNNKKELHNVGNE